MWRFALGVAISLSTLTTKQHLISDVIGGIALAWLCVWLTDRYAGLLRLPGSGKPDSSGGHSG
jgi:membrane-associated phospholipid phosphatase